jgi:hypothetical protein
MRGFHLRLLEREAGDSVRGALFTDGGRPKMFLTSCSREFARRAQSIVRAPILDSLLWI